MTLIEMLMVVAIAAILLTSAVPGLARMLSVHRATVVANDLLQAIAWTRGEALARNRRVYLAPTGAHWSDGWAIFIDRDDDRVFDPSSDELIGRHAALLPSITIVNPSNPAREPFTDVGSPQRTYILFDGNGYPRQRNGAFNIGSLVVTDRTGGATTLRTICLAAYGRVRVVNGRAGCS